MDITPANIVKFIESNKFHEIEFRYKVTTKFITDFLASNTTKFAPTAFNSQTVNLIYIAKRTNKDKQMPNFIVTRNSDGTKEYMLKQKMLAIKYDNITLNVSEEIPQKEVNTPSHNPNYVIRIKNRLSIPINSGQFDITQVCTLTDDQKGNTQEIMRCKSALFKPMEGHSTQVEIYNAFLANITNPVITSLEMEYEFTKDAKITEQMIAEQYALDLVGPEHFKELNTHKIFNVICSDLKRKATSLKTLLNNAVGLTISAYNLIYPPIGWYITPKADGYIALAIFNKDGQHYLLDSNETKIITADKVKPGYTIIVGESCKKMFYAFDLLMVDGIPTVDLPFEDRLIELNKFIVDKIITDQTTVVIKDHILITSDLQRSFKSVLELSIEYETDGHILVSPDNNYFETQNYKIKEHNTIDFLVIECPKFLKKKDIYNGKNVYLLFCSINEFELQKAMILPIEGYKTIFPDRFQGMKPIQFCPSDDPMAYIWDATDAEAKIINEYQKRGRVIAELDYEKGKWKLIKVREDRINEPNYFGNHLLKAAEPSWLSNKYPLKITEMHEPPKNYFGQGKNLLYEAQVGYNSFVKYTILNNVTKLVKSKTVVDLAAGKGQDLFRYYSLQYQKGIFCDIDPVALSELVSRRFQAIRDKTKNYKMNVQILHRDLNEPADDTLAMFHPLIQNTEIGLIVCNLAIHYLIYNVDKLHNFIRLVKNLGSKGTYFYYTTMSGQAVIDLIGDAKEWKAHQSNILKYRIIKEFTGRNLDPFGQSIKTKMPFSDELYSENLVNIDFINTQFKKFGFELINSRSFSVYLEDFKKHNPMVYNQLTEDDKKFISLYHFSIFRL